MYMRDFDFNVIREAFHLFGVSLDDLTAVAIAVFDHGNAPLDISDRKFRFDYLDERIRAENRLSAFAYAAEKIPAQMTRLQAVANSSRDIPAQVIVMDTAPAAVLGATLDPLTQRHERGLFLNIGNMHTLAFRLGSEGIEGVFEHHTGLLDQAHLEELLLRFAEGSLTNENVFGHHGHAASLDGRGQFIEIAFFDRVQVHLANLDLSFGICQRKSQRFAFLTQFSAHSLAHDKHNCIAFVFSMRMLSRENLR